MIYPTKIFLIGMPGSGKTNFGKRLAQAIGRQFFDTDAQIEKLVGMSIPQMFTELGEDYFREAEQKVLNMLIRLDEPAVIATGGGLPCFFDNMDLMNKSGATIFLNTPLDIVTERVAKKRAERPLIGQMNPEELHKELQALYDKRFSFYKRASFISEANVEDILAHLTTVRK